MKCFVHSIIVTLLFFLVHDQGYSQQIDKNDVAIYIYRHKQTYASGTKIEIRLNSKPIGKLKNGSRMIIKTNTKDSLIFTGFNHLNHKISSNCVIIHPKSGNKYYIETDFWGQIWSNEFAINIFSRDSIIGKKEFTNPKLFKDKYDEIRIFNVP